MVVAVVLSLAACQTVTAPADRVCAEPKPGTGRVDIGFLKEDIIDISHCRDGIEEFEYVRTARSRIAWYRTSGWIYHVPDDRRFRETVGSLESLSMPVAAIDIVRGHTPMGETVHAFIYLDQNPCLFFYIRPDDIGSSPSSNLLNQLVQGVICDIGARLDIDDFRRRALFELEQIRLNPDPPQYRDEDFKPET